MSYKGVGESRQTTGVGGVGEPATTKGWEGAVTVQDVVLKRVQRVGRVGGA